MIGNASGHVLGYLMRKLVLLPAALMLAVAVHADPLPPGTIELSGNASYEHLSSGDDSGNRIILAPGVYYYPVSQVFLGPIAEMTFQWDDDISISQQEIGAAAGVLLNPTETEQYFYAGAAATWLRASSSIDFLGETESNSVTGYSLKGFVGLKIRLGKNFCLNLQPTYDFKSIDDQNSNSFGLVMGFSGFVFP